MTSSCLLILLDRQTPQLSFRQRGISRTSYYAALFPKWPLTEIYLEIYYKFQ